MSLAVTYDFATGEFDRAMERIYEPIAKAGTAAIRIATDEAKIEARQSIAAAGFSRRWQLTLRGEVYPKKPSANAAGVLFHKIAYAGIFEEGGTIPGSPMLWIPLPSAPKKVGGKRMTPARFVDQMGPLFAVRSRSGKPMLAARAAIPKAEARRGPPYKVTPSRLKRGPAARTTAVMVPMFIGQEKVDIPKKFGVAAAMEAAAARLPGLYLSQLDPEV